MSQQVVKRERIYDRCAYKDCENGRIKTKSHLYRFPKPEDPRYDFWIQHTGNPCVKYWAVGTLRSAGLCKSHFHPDCFLVNGKLRKDAIPIPYFGQQDKENEFQAECDVSADESNSSFQSYDTESFTAKCGIENDEMLDVDNAQPTSDVMEMNIIEEEVSSTLEETAIIIDTNEECLTDAVTESPQDLNYIQPILPIKLPTGLEFENKNLLRINEELQRTIKATRKEIRLLRAQFRRAVVSKNCFQQRCKKKSIDEFLDEFNCTGSAARTMVKLQLHRKKAPYSDEEKDLAMELFISSTAAYTRLLNTGCNFPSTSTVRQWISEADVGG